MNLYVESLTQVHDISPAAARFAFALKEAKSAKQMLKHSNRLEDSFFIVGYLSNTNKYIGSGSKIQALLKIILALILTSPGI